MLEVRRGEGRDLAVAFATFLSFMTAHGVLETARDSLFLARIPADRLPRVYFAMVVAGFSAAWVARRAPRNAVGWLTGFVLAVAAAGTVALAFVVRAEIRVAPYLVYVWVGVVATFVTVQIWQQLGERFTVAQGKRLFGIMGAGGALGLSIGSALSAWLATRPVSSPGLLLVAAAILAVSVVPALLLRGGGNPGDEQPEALPPPYRVMKQEPHARRLFLLVLTSTATVTIADYLFKTSVAASVSRDRLPAFFGTFYALVAIADLLIQLGLSAWFLRRFGAARGAALGPASVLFGAAAFAAMPMFGTVLAMRAADGALRHSLERTSLEILFQPLPRLARRSLKAVMETVGRRGGQALASAAILLLVFVGAGPRVLALTLAVLALTSLAILRGTSHSYFDLFRRDLRPGVIGGEKHVPELDEATLAVVLASLNSLHEAEAMSALRLVESQGRCDLVPPLMVFHPSKKIAILAIGLLGRRAELDALPLLGRLQASEDADIRMAAMLTAHAIAPNKVKPEVSSDDDDPRLRMSALLALGAVDSDAQLDALAALREVAAGDDHALQSALAQAISRRPIERWTELLVLLAAHGRESVRVEVAVVARTLRSETMLDPLTKMLAKRETRIPARDALLAMGEVARTHLEHKLGEINTDLAVRRSLPYLLAMFNRAETAPLLLATLVSERDGMSRYRILRALGVMVAVDSSLRLDHSLLLRLLHDTLSRIITLMAARVVLEAEPATASLTMDLLLALLKQKEGLATERLFRLLLLTHPSSDVALSVDGLRHVDHRRRAAAREMLGHVVDGELRHALLVLSDDLDSTARLARFRNAPAATDVRGVLVRLFQDASESVRLLASEVSKELEADPQGRAHARG